MAVAVETTLKGDPAFGNTAEDINFLNLYVLMTQLSDALTIVASPHKSDLATPHINPHNTHP